MTQKTVLSGVQPSGSVTLGNYLGAIKQWVPLQEQHKCFYCIVDLHAMTASMPEALDKKTLMMAATYLACGLDPQKCTLFVQSHVPAHTQLAWILMCQTPLGWLNRMTQFKDKAGKKKDIAGLGLYAYPVLQAADILCYGADLVPVGEDQKQHLELTRDIAIAFQNRVGQQVFTLPEPMISDQSGRIMSLKDGTKKMSKSDASSMACLFLADTDDDLRLKIQKAKTDPHVLPETPKGLEHRPEAKNLLTLYSLLSDSSLEATCLLFQGKPFINLKEALSDLVIASLAPIRSRFFRYREDVPYLRSVLKEGSFKARETSEKTLQKVQESLCFLSAKA